MVQQSSALGMGSSEAEVVADGIIEKEFNGSNFLSTEMNSGQWWKMELAGAYNLRRVELYASYATHGKLTIFSPRRFITFTAIMITSDLRQIRYVCFL